MPTIHVQDTTKDRIDTLQSLEEHTTQDSTIRMLVDHYENTRKEWCRECRHHAMLSAFINSGQCPECGATEWYQNGPDD